MYICIIIYVGVDSCIHAFICVFVHACAISYMGVFMQRVNRYMCIYTCIVFSAHLNKNMSISVSNVISPITSVRIFWWELGPEVEASKNNFLRAGRGKHVELGKSGFAPNKSNNNKSQNELLTAVLWGRHMCFALV